MFRKVILSSIFILCLSGSVFNQTDKYSVPVKWERYKVTGKEISILLPKLPVLLNRSDVCNQQETQIYSAYAEEVVYTLKITSRYKTNRVYCSQKKDFDKETFSERLKELQPLSDKIEESKYTQNEREVFKINDKITTYWLFNDFQNKRWFELWVTHRDDIKPETKEFIESIKIEKNPTGIEIGEGSNRTLGDLTEELTIPSDEKDDKKIPLSGEGNGSGSGRGNADISKENLIPILIIQKPTPRYTDAARQNNVQGTVTLRVTFLANGGVGAITPVSALPYGLTEQAIAAAAKIVFIPAKRNGITYTISKTVVYSFSIY